MKFSFTSSIATKVKTLFNMQNNTSTKYNVTEEELASLKEAFTLYDTDKNGAIDLKQFASILKSLEVETDDKKIKALVDEVDKNHDGHIDFDEFVSAMTRFTSAATGTPEVALKKWKTYPSIDKNAAKATAAGADSKRAKSYTRRMSRHEVDELQLCFEKFDKNGDGQISLEELREVMNGLGEKLTEQELKDMMQDADTNHDGYIDFQEFKALMPNLNGHQEQA